MSRYLNILFASTFLILIDQLSKFWVVRNYSFENIFSLFQCKYFGLNFFLTYNKGIAFGLFNNAGNWQNNLFLLISISAVIIILCLIINNKTLDRLEKISLIMILSGTVGNIIDRMIYHQVVDFIDFYILLNKQMIHWYVFNIADSYICIGVLALIFKIIKK